MDPSHMLIFGKTGCGKTHYLLELLDSNLVGPFNNIYLICPTFSVNASWQNWKYKYDPNFNVVETYNVNAGIRGVLEHHEMQRIARLGSGSAPHLCGVHSLIILDDVASSKDVRSKNSELVKLGFSGRHLGISVIVITQQLTSIAKAYRENINKLVTFYTPGRNDMEVIVDEYLDDEAKPLEIRRILRDVPYARLEVLLSFPYGYKVITPPQPATRIA